jgi:sporulation protein YlmC with PRC-barrel domain
MRPITANSLTAAEVRSPSGEDLGKIVDFMLDTERGCVVYAVLATGGVLGVGAKMLAVPPRSLQLSGDRCLKIDVDTAALDAADGIDRANPPESADASLPSAATRATSNVRGRNHG